MALGTGRGRVEPGPVVFEAQHDVLVFFRHRYRHLGRVGVLERVHDALARDVEHQQGDRRRQLDVLHVAVEADV